MQDVDELHEVATFRTKYEEQFLNKIVFYFQLNYLIEHNKENFSEVKQGVEQALETVKINTQWQQMHGKSIHDVLQKFSNI